MKRGRFVPATRILAALALTLAASPALARNDSIVRQHLDAGRVQFSGMDINGDEIGDSIRVDRIKRSLFYFVGDKRGNYSSFDPATLAEEDRHFVPDVLLEKDLDGDEIDDLVIYNRAYLEKYKDNEPVFLRILAASIFIGHPKGAYLSLSSSALSTEARGAILSRARKAVLPAP